MLFTKLEVHNVSQEEDRATAIGNMHKKFVKDHVCGSGDILADRQTRTHTHRGVLITILCNHTRWRSKYFVMCNCRSEHL